MEFLTAQLEQRLGLDRESALGLAEYPANNSRQETADFFYGLLGDATPGILDEYYSILKSEDIRSTSVSTSASASRSQLASPSGSGASTPHTGELNIGQGVPQIKGVWDKNHGKKKADKSQKGSSSSTANPSKIKVDSLADINAAISQLEVSSATLKNRTRCDCMAMRHGLFNLAPNCLYCGKIICQKEGLGPCTACGKPLMDAEQVSQITSVLKSEKELITASMGKKAKQRAGIPVNDFEQQQNTRANLEKANEQLEKLLNFQDTGAQRTKIIDQVSDFEISTNLSKWASPEEQAQQLKQQQRQLRKAQLEQEARSGRGKKSVTLSIRGGKVYMEERTVSAETQLPPEEPTPENEKPKSVPKSKVSTYWNPKKAKDRLQFSPADLDNYFPAHKTSFKGATSDGPDRVKFDQSADVESLITMT